MKKPIVILEVKTKSPYGFKSNKTWDELFEIAEKHADIISIHTNPWWAGSFDLIQKARLLTDKPILAKGFHNSDYDIERAISCGADYVLVVGRVPEVHKEKLLIEPLKFEDLKNIPEDYKVVWNKRNLADGSIKNEDIKDVKGVFSGWICQASMIKSVDDVYPDIDAVLVGENLEGFVDGLQK